MQRTAILRQGKYLIASLQEDLADSELIELEETLLDTVGTYQSEGVLIDVSLLGVLDSFAARSLANLAKALRLRGARSVVVGIQPEVALSMIMLGIELQGVDTALDLDLGLKILDTYGG